MGYQPRALEMARGRYIILMKFCPMEGFLLYRERGIATRDGLRVGLPVRIYPSMQFHVSRLWSNTEFWIGWRRSVNNRTSRMAR